MPTRTSFIGLILLIAALLVASVPQLLTPTADGVERLAVRTGMLDEERPPKRTRSEPEDEQPAPGKLADPALTLRGHAVEEDGDLRDTVEVAERAATSRGRLAAGTTRRPLPGALVEADRALPPASIEDGVLLDVAGCPMFRPDRKSVV